MVLTIDMGWRDEFLQWAPGDYDDIDVVYVSANDIWVPKIRLFNDARLDDRVNTRETTASVDDEGNVVVQFHMIYEIICALQLQYFPFDEQSCELVFGDWRYTSSELEFQLDENGADISYFQVNPRWGLVAFESSGIPARFTHEHGDEYNTLTFILDIRRRPTMPVCYLIVPNILVNIIVVMSFLLPCDAAERCTLGISLYLCMVIYLLLFEQLIPVSDVTPIVVIYISCTLIMVAFSQFHTIVILRVHYNGIHDNERMVPSWVRTLIIHKLARLVYMHDLIVPDEEHEQMLFTKGLSKNLAAVMEFAVRMEGQIYEAEHANEHDIDDTEDDESLMEEPRLNGTLPLSKRDASDVASRNKIYPLMQGRQKEYDAKQDFFQSRKRHRSSVHIVGGDDGLKQVINREDLVDNHELLIYKVLSQLKTFEQKFARTERQKEIKCEWQQVAMIVDRVAFYFYALLTVILWITMACVYPRRNTHIVL